MYEKSWKKKGCLVLILRTLFKNIVLITVVVKFTGPPPPRAQTSSTRLKISFYWAKTTSENLNLYENCFWVGGGNKVDENGKLWSD